MVRRNGNVKNVRKNMQFNLIGKLIVRFVVLENINVIVEHFFSRRDSFITHRAFCDALAVESARFTPTNLNFMRNELINGGISNNFQHNGNSQFGNSLFRPEFMGLGLDHQLNVDHHGQKSRMPIWLENPNSTNSNDFLFGPSSSSSNNLPHDLVQMTAAHNNNNNNQHWFINAAGGDGGGGSGVVDSGIDSSSSFPSRVLNMEKENKRHLSETINSMYYNNHQQETTATTTTTMPAGAHMSATALLQKAAQMGSTRSNSSLFGNGFGLMGSSLSKNNIGQGQFASNDQNLMNGLMMNSPASSCLEGNANGNKNLEPFFNKGKQLNLSGIEAIDGSLTRDFLGVGGNERSPFLSKR